MKFACESCQTRYTISDEKVRGKVLKIRCKKCGAVITVKEEASSPAEPEAPPIEERTRVADIGLLEKLRQAEHARESPPPAEPAAPLEWFAMIGGDQVGPLAPQDLQARIDAGDVNDRSHVWRDGMGDWRRAGDVPELSSLFAPPPVAPRPSPPPSLPRAAPPDDDVPTVARVRPDLSELMRDEPAPDPSPAQSLSQSFDDDPPGRSSSPALAVATAPSNNLADLLGNLGDDEHEHTGAGPIAVPRSGDPFAQVPDAPSLAAPVIGEQTRFFMKKAGVTNRNPWWKYAIFAVILMGLPVAVIYALGQAGVGGTVMVVDASTGETHAVQRFSFEAIKVNGLGALLSGPPKGAHAVALKHAPVKVAHVAKALVDPHAHDVPKANLTPDQEKKIQANMGLIGGDPSDLPSASGPIERKDTKTEQTDQGAAGLSDEVVAKVVGENASSFNQCVEDKLKRDPSWKGGRINLSVTIGPSGTVLKSSIDKSDVAHSDVGDCLTARIKRMHFPRFAGDDPQEIQFPLLLTNGG